MSDEITTQERGCVVVTMRNDEQVIRLVTTDGHVDVLVLPHSASRAKVVVRAPMKVRVTRIPNPLKESANVVGT